MAELFFLISLHIVRYKIFFLSIGNIFQVREISNLKENSDVFMGMQKLHEIAVSCNAHIYNFDDYQM